MTQARSFHARTLLPGSARPPVAAADVDGPLDPAVVVEATIVLRRRGHPDAADFTGPPLSRDELALRFGAESADLRAVAAAVASAGAEVLSADAATRLVRVRGAAGTLSTLFGTSLMQAAPHVAGQRRRAGELSVPAALSGAITAVLGLDDRPQAAARLARPAAAAAVSYTPLQLATAYDLPDGDGSGQTIAIIELGGGFAHADLDAYFGGLGLIPPSVTAVGVDGATNVAGKDPDGADGEVLLDIEVAGAIAPGAKQLVYFAPNTDDGFLDAITQAAHARPAPTAMSISWGQSEDQWSAQARGAMDDALADAALLGVTVTVAAGDNGSTDSTGSTGSTDSTGSTGSTDSTDASDRQASKAQHADFPASSPHALACGGTALHLAADGSVRSETVWNDGGQGGATGGGVSDAFPVPHWQAQAGVPVRAGRGGGKAGRGVPDVAGVADPQTGYQVLVDGTPTVIGGTSAVSPLWAGIVCRLAQSLGRPLGLLQPALYAAASAGHVPPGLRDITAGSNGAYSAEAGWDACTGLGVPVGTALLEALRSKG